MYIKPFDTPQVKKKNSTTVSRDNIQPIRKQQAENQSEEGASHWNGKGEKKDETGRGGKVKLSNF